MPGTLQEFQQQLVIGLLLTFLAGVFIGALCVFVFYKLRSL